MTESFLRWPGGKYGLVEKILPYIYATPHKRFIEAFCGSAIITLNKKALSKSFDIEVLNDFNNELINLFRVIKTRPQELVDFLDWEIASEYIFNKIKHAPIEKLGKVDRAGRFLILNRQSFGGKVSTEEGGGLSWVPSTDRRSGLDIYDLQRKVRIIHKRLAAVSLPCRDYRKLFASKTLNVRSTLWYLDPPYFGGYTDAYTGEVKLEDFFPAVSSLKGKVIISHEPSKEFDKVFSEWPRVVIGARRSSLALKKDKSKTPELLYFNYEPPLHRKGFL